MLDWFRRPSGQWATEGFGMVVIVTTGVNTYTKSGMYRHATIRPMNEAANAPHIRLCNYRTLRDIKADCEKVVEALNKENSDERADD